ncbi:hypothetical protein NX059_008760 [Plenodomus lindquistii]|nr:hypothetical protein NX059_008760 [Plenodomus lindquistii]
MPLLAAADAQINYPLDQQFPPVARVGSPFTYQFAPTTFSGSQILHYALAGSPSWLSLDDESRTLSGIPQPNDAGFATFNITATGDDESVASMESKLYISMDDGPVAKADISAPLSAAGQLTGPKTVNLKPSKQFQIDFPSDSFESNGNKLSYYAILSDHTPLPAWIRFNASSMRFTGTTLSTTSAQALEVLLIANITPGFADASFSFTILTSQHTLAFEPFSQTINVAGGQDIIVTDLKSILRLDGSVIRDDQIQSSSADLPSWMSFNNETLAVSGSAPANATLQNLVITAQDQFGDSAEYTIHLILESGLFSANLGDLNAIIGAHFSYVVPRTILVTGDEQITIDFSTLSDDLTFDPATFTISGTIPRSFAAQNVECVITATSADGTSQNTQSFHINVLKSTTSPQSGAVSTSDNQHGSTKRNRDGMIAGAVIGGSCAALLLGILAVCLCRKKKKSGGYFKQKQPRSPRKSEISRPTFIPYGWPDNDMDLHGDDDLEKGKDAHEPDVARSPEQPPKLDLQLAANRHRKDSHSLTDTIGDDSTRILDIFDESSFGIHNDITPSQHPHDSWKESTELAKKRSQRSNEFRKHKRRTTTVYQDQIHRSTGLAVNRRITGMGHGRHTYSPSRSNTNFSSARRPMSSSSYTTRRTSIFSMAPSAIPQSPAARKHKTFVTTPTDLRHSIRVVPSSRRSSLKDQRTIDEKRSSYIRKRASAQSPFFSAGFRASSSTYTSPPAFINEARSASRNALSPLSRNTIVRPNDSVIEGKEKNTPTEAENRPDVPALVESSSQEFPGSLRRYRTNRPHTAISPPRSRVEKSYNRPGTTIGAAFGEFRRRASTRTSLRAYDLKASLNDLTGSKVFEDAEMSDSVYSAEERDIEEAEQRKTVTQSQFTLPPLNLDSVDTKRSSNRYSKTEKQSKRKSKRESKRDSNRELKRASERDPTPYFYLPPDHEHGGKENASSSYNMGHRSTPVRSETKGGAKILSSAERPKTMASRTTRTAEARESNRISQKPIIRQDSPKERHSRKSIHSRTQSRQSGGTPTRTKKTRSHSRSQSSAYPFFDAALLETTPYTKPLSSLATTNNPVTPSPTTTITATTARPVTTSTTSNASLTNMSTNAIAKPTLITRDLSGNLTFYGADEEPTIEKLDSSSIAFCSRNGTISPTARQSRLASLHLSTQSPAPTPPPRDARRETVATGLGFFPPQTPGDKRKVASGGRGRDVTAEVEGEMRGEGEGEGAGSGRKTWGSIRTVLGRSGRWVGGGGYWEGRGKEEKVFI